MKKSRTESRPKTLAKSATGIRGFDEITGGLPAGRPTLICGGTGCGKASGMTGASSKGPSKAGL